MTTTLYLSSCHNSEAAKDEHAIVGRVQAVPQSRQEQSRSSRAEWSSVKADSAENSANHTHSETGSNLSLDCFLLHSVESF